MSTRSNIAIINSDNTISAIYCHSDGYPSYNGKMLIENYTDSAKVQELIKLGGISILAQNLSLPKAASNPEGKRPFDLNYAIQSNYLRDEHLVITLRQPTAGTEEIFTWINSYLDTECLTLKELYALNDSTVKAYHRDRGEELEVSTYQSQEELFEAGGIMIEYYYLFDPATSKWSCYDSTGVVIDLYTSENLK